MQRERERERGRERERETESKVVEMEMDKVAVGGDLDTAVWSRRVDCWPAGGSNFSNRHLTVKPKKKKTREKCKKKQNDSLIKITQIIMKVINISLILSFNALFLSTFAVRSPRNRARILPPDQEYHYQDKHQYL